MAIQDTLKDLWHNLEEYAWKLADFLEDKGVPIASFCESKGVSPLLLFGGILMLVILIIAGLGGAGAPAKDAMLKVTVVDEQGNPVSGQYLTLTYTGGEEPRVRTDLSGEATFTDLPYTQVNIAVDSEKYVGSVSKSITQKQDTVRLSVQTKKGTLSVTVKDEAGANVVGGSIEIVELGKTKVLETEALNGASSYEFSVPAGVTYKISVKSNSGGELASETKKVDSGMTATVELGIRANAADTATVTVLVKDENGNAVRNATVNLRNSRDNFVIGRGMTNAIGQAVFGEVAIQTRVYPEVYVAGNRRYGQLGELEGRNLAKTVQSIAETIEVRLPLNGKVEVQVSDEDTRAAISGATVQMMNKAGEAIGEAKTTNANGIVNFAGFEENVYVYPVVEAVGYSKHDRISEAQPITYSRTTRFGVMLKKDASARLSLINVQVTDSLYREPLQGIDAVLSEGGALLKQLSNAKNVTFQADANKIYTVSLHKRGYLYGLLEGITVGTHEAALSPATNLNSGEVKVCTYIVNNGQPTPARSRVQLRKSNGPIIDSGTTAVSGSESCIVFTGVPEEWSVYAHAENDGYAPIDSNPEDVIARQDGVTEINISFNGLPPNAAITGDVKVCVKDEKGNAVQGAEVLLYDADIEGPSWSGEYRKTTVSDGCAIFMDLPSTKTSADGTLVPVRVYAVVSAANYATYNGKTEGNTVEVQPLLTTPLNVRLGTGQSICVNVQNQGQAVADATVSLCANAQCTQLLDTQKTGSDGHAVFSSDVQTVTVKVVTNINRMRKQTIQNFALAQVTRGACGIVDVVSINTYVTLTLDGVSTMMEVLPLSTNEIRFIAKINDRVATGGAFSTGGVNKIRGATGEEVQIELSSQSGNGIIPSSIMAVDQTEGRYSIPFTVPAAEGDYRVTLKASVPNCDACQGDEKTITVRVGDGDEDNDGVLDEFDRCRWTAAGTAVDVNGCPVATVTDSDGDNVPNDRDQCPNTLPGVQVGSNGCEIASVRDSDGDGVPDQYDAFPNDASKKYPNDGTDTNSNSVPDAYERVAGMNEQIGGYQTSIQICVEDEFGSPVYSNDIRLYQTSGYGYGTSGYRYQSDYASSSRYAYPSGYGPTGYPSTYGSAYGSMGYMPPSTYYGTSYSSQYGNLYRQPYPMTYYDLYQSPIYSSSLYGGYSGYGGYGQPWRAVQSWQNCRVFVGYGSMQYLDTFNFFANFHLSVSGGDNYEPYDSRTSPMDMFRLSFGGPGGMLSIVVRLKSKAPSPGAGTGTIFEPGRTVELSGESWKAAGRTTEVYPIITDTSRDINIKVIYQIEKTAPDSLEYVVEYALQNACFEIVSEGGRRSVVFRKGEVVVEDDITIRSVDSCWQRNDLALERDFTLSLGGQLVQIGNKETRGYNKFSPVQVSVKPLIGAESRVAGISDLAGLGDKLELRYGVVTTGTPPYCVSQTANTGNSPRMADSDAKKHKIVIDFKANTFKSSLESLATQIGNLIRTQLDKAPVDCKVYLTVMSEFQGHVEAGQGGTACHNAQVASGVGARLAAPWEKLFCEAVAGGQTEGDIQLGGGYSMRLGSH